MACQPPVWRVPIIRSLHHENTWTSRDVHAKVTVPARDYGQGAARARGISAGVLPVDSAFVCTNLLLQLKSQRMALACIHPWCHAACVGCEARSPRRAPGKFGAEAKSTGEGSEAEACGYQGEPRQSGSLALVKSIRAFCVQSALRAGDTDAVRISKELWGNSNPSYDSTSVPVSANREAVRSSRVSRCVPIAL